MALMHTREDAIRSDRGSELGLKTVGIQDYDKDHDQMPNEYANDNETAITEVKYDK